VERLQRFPLTRGLASLKLTIAILVVFAVAIAKATFIESAHGAEAARDLVYNARWFELLLVLFVINLIVVFLDRLPYTRRQTGFVLTHLAMIVILAGAGITRYFGYEGSMHIRDGQRSSELVTHDTYLQLREGRQAASSLVRLWRTGRQHLTRKLHLDGTTYRAEITSYWPHYRQRVEASDSGPAAVELAVTTGQHEPRRLTLIADQAGNVGGRALLFHDGSLPPPHDGDLRILVGRDSSGALWGRAPFALQKVDMSSGKAGSEIVAGTDFPLQTMALYREPSGRFSLVVSKILDHARLVPAPSDDSRDPGAARVTVRAPGGATGTVLVEDGDQDGRTITVGDRTLTVAVAPRIIRLPFALQLDRFVLQKYPGSNNPATYESYVRIFDKARGVDGEPFHIYMNHPLSFRGSKFFQSSYDLDEHGTILSVNHDPGKWPTYAGYLLISLGFVLTFARDLLWPIHPDAVKGGRS